MGCQVCLQSLNGDVKSDLEHQKTLRDREEIARSIVNAINSLPVFQREVFVLNHYGGLDIEAIARLKDSNHETVKLALKSADEEIYSCLRRFR